MADPFTSPPPEMMPPGYRPSGSKTWPTAVGIVAIVFGAAGALGGVLGMLGPLINHLVIEYAPPDQVALQQAQQPYQWWLAGMSVVALLLAVWLLWSGIGLLKRRPRAAGGLKGWAAAKILLTLVMAGVQGAMQANLWEVMQQQQPGGAMPESFSSVMIVVTVVFALAWGLALPVFVLVWFGRTAVKSDVRAWSNETDVEFV